MIHLFSFATALILMPQVKVLEFPKVNRDSISAIDYSEEGYTSRSTNAICVWMKNEDSIQVIHDSEGRIRPSTLVVSSDSLWVLFNNPYASSKVKGCPDLLCFLPAGECKCSGIIADSGYYLPSIPHIDRFTPEFTVSDWKIYDITTRNKSIEGKKPIHLDPQEVLKRFQENFNPKGFIKYQELQGKK